ncbi:MAG: hypothetical protein ACI9EZ_000572 [Halobacteriales archaeon]|jgi:hypothetical protein
MEYSPRYRLLPTSDHRKLLGWQKNTVRQVYNHALYRRYSSRERQRYSDAYDRYGRHPSAISTISSRVRSSE